MTITNAQIAGAIEQYAPLSLQEPWDNSGWQLGNPFAACTGALICVDASCGVVDEAVKKGLNLIITHHPLIFHPLKQILTGTNRVSDTVAKAISAGISIYSCHTAIDNAPNGVSWQIASDLGLCNIEPLAPGHVANSGTGAIGRLPEPMSPQQLARYIKTAMHTDTVRCSTPETAPQKITTLALCGGAGAEFVPPAIAAGAQAYLTSDTKHNQFTDHANQIFLIDIAHYESENCTKRIFYHILTQKFPNFAAQISESETNPIVYL